MQVVAEIIRIEFIFQIGPTKKLFIVIGPLSKKIYRESSTLI
jgi:hypothetical protein